MGYRVRREARWLAEILGLNTLARRVQKARGSRRGRRRV